MIRNYSQDSFSFTNWAFIIFSHSLDFRSLFSFFYQHKILLYDRLLPWTQTNTVEQNGRNLTNFSCFMVCHRGIKSVEKSMGNSFHFWVFISRGPWELLYFLTLSHKYVLCGHTDLVKIVEERSRGRLKVLKWTQWSWWHIPFVSVSCFEFTC